jgi:hypothetical protein
MSKGILSLGCSFSWGESLYFYSDLENLPFHKTHHWDPSKVRKSMELYKDLYRFPTLVGNHYNTWIYSPNNQNGGDNLTNVQNFENELLNGNFLLSDFKLVIWQLTDAIRDASHETNYLHYLTDVHSDSSELKNRYNEYMKILDNQLDSTLNFVDRKSKFFEDNGIKVLTLVWFVEMFKHKKYQELFKHRHVPLTFGNETVDYFNDVIESELHDEHLETNNITIASDFKERGLQTLDCHFNKKGHRCVADSIIKKLEQDNFKL